MTFFKDNKPDENKSDNENNKSAHPLLDLPPLMRIVHEYAPDEKEVSKFLQHVAFGQQKEAEEMLAKNPLLVLAKGTVTDYSGREFKNVTGFQYALWAHDAHMWQMIEKYFPPSELMAELKLPHQMKSQFDEVENGLTYTIKVDKDGINIVDKNELKEKEQKGEIQTLTKKESHYNFEELKNALDTFVKYMAERFKAHNSSYDGWSKPERDKADEIWQKIVGGAQRLMPAHVANWYCSNMPFENVKASDFDAKKELVRELKTYSGDLLLPLDQYNFRVGFHFGVQKRLFCGRLCAMALLSPSLCAGVAAECAAIDLAAITALCEARQQDLKSFKEKLEKAEQSKTIQPGR